MDLTINSRIIADDIVVGEKPDIEVKANESLSYSIPIGVTYRNDKVYDGGVFAY